MNYNDLISYDQNTRDNIKELYVLFGTIQSKENIYILLNKIYIDLDEKLKEKFETNIMPYFYY